MHMQKPSIEHFLSRTPLHENSYPIARHVARMPLVGIVGRAWVRAKQNEGSASLWISLPPVAA